MRLVALKITAKNSLKTRIFPREIKLTIFFAAQQ